jgi:hypothetical protein
LKIVMHIFLWSLAGGLLWSPSARAQWAPQGSYLRSCSDVGMRGDTLVAVCRDRDGVFRRTKLPEARSCVGDIGNNDGRLQCQYGGGPGGGFGGPSRSGRVPPGSYLQSCGRVTMNGDTLVAVCTNRRGKERQSALQNVSRCRGDIGNNDGLLSCAR